jgi:hypothetical protein
VHGAAGVAAEAVVDVVVAEAAQGAVDIMVLGVAEVV